MNTFIKATANKALCDFIVSQAEYQTLTRLIADPSLSEQDATLARRVLYGVRRGIVSLV
ncbi:MAG: hypothetical protein F6J87_20600 [Spirulina sp. SIO3F2]|nr:hypothetical protein [Spirulina sp. SIO3F2]